MSTVMVWILSGIIGVISSLVASGVFLWCVSKWRPNLEISPVISRGADKEGNQRFYVKVINRTRYPVIGVKARMSIATPQNAAGGTIDYVEPIQLKTSEMMELAGYSRRDKDAQYAVQFMVAEDLDERWSQEETAKLRFQIYATHSLTGFGKAFQKTYYQKRSALVGGEFMFGNTFNTT